MNYLMIPLLLFNIYQPSPVSILDDLYLRGVITLSTGEEARALILEGCALEYTLNKAVNICFFFNKDTVEIARIALKDETLQNTSSGGGNVQICNKSKTANYAKQLSYNVRDTSILLNDRSMSDKKEILLEASKDINLEKVAMHSPLIVLGAKQHSFNKCFCNTKNLIIVSQDPNSLYESIEFVFEDKTEASHGMCGEIDFEACNGNLIVFGVKTIRVQFSEQAFSSQGKPILEIKPGEDLF